MELNGEAIYNTTVFKPNQNFTDSIYYTDKPDLGIAYVILINGKFPQGDDLHYEGGPVPKSGSQVSEHVSVLLFV